MPTQRDLRSAAALLGSRGGRKNSEAQRQARSQNGRKGGRKPSYRLVAGELQRRTGEHWTALDPPYSRAAREFLRRLAIQTRSLRT